MGRRLAIAFGGVSTGFVLLLAMALSWPVPSTEGDFTLNYNPTEWPEVGPNGEYETRNGDRLPLRVYGESETETALILLHGISIYGFCFDEMATYLAEQSAIRVYVPDLRGHGYAAGPRGDIDYEEQLVDDVADLVAHVRAEMPQARVIMGGHSGGGGLAVRFAGNDQSEGIDGYFLVAPALGMDAPSTNVDFGGLFKVRLPRVIALRLFNAVGVDALDGLDVLYMTYPEKRQRERMVLTYSWRYAKGFAPPDYAAALESIDVPLLLVAGSEDEVFDAEQYPSIIEEHAPGGEVVIKPGYNHFADVLNKQETLEIYAAWLEGVE
ncbi:alpha/beta hydrolase [Halomonas mongoliensis]|uniref:alpha/beta hydrolase n=1 Tax=Halomonas mongoliensis TaxID=321265 RepID=UPI00403B190B